MNVAHAGLVLEGGGLRGVYTSGVLRFFMDRQLYFPYVIGVSIGGLQCRQLRLPAALDGPRMRLGRWWG
jgi:predicted patatin/cPLA2 family phospholipase